MASIAGLWERYLAESNSFMAETKEVSFPKLREEKNSYRTIFQKPNSFYSIDLNDEIGALNYVPAPTHP